MPSAQSSQFPCQHWQFVVLLYKTVSQNELESYKTDRAANLSMKFSIVILLHWSKIDFSSNTFFGRRSQNLQNLTLSSTGNFVGFLLKRGQLVLSLTCLSTIFPNDNFIFSAWHCVNNIRMCKVFYKLCCFIEVRLLLGYFSLRIISVF